MRCMLKILREHNVTLYKIDGKMSNKKRDLQPSEDGEEPLWLPLRSTCKNLIHLSH